MNEFRIGIDASNLRRGGGRTHLIELLSLLQIKREIGLAQLLFWGSRETLGLLVDKPWLTEVGSGSGKDTFAPNPLATLLIKQSSAFG